MAKPGGIIKFKGKLDDLSSYDSVYGPIIRRKGGPSKQQIKKSPKLLGTREHNEEFKESAKCGKLWRSVLLPFTTESPDFRLVPRVTQLMYRLKDLDQVSARGKRLVSRGLRGKAGRALITGFDLNSQAPLASVLKTVYVYKSGQFGIKDLVPERDLKAPKGSTHVHFTLVVSRIDFVKKQHKISQQEMTILYDHNSQDLDLKVKALRGTGFRIAVLQIKFLQEVNGEFYPLENKRMNCLSVVGVG